jgi:glycosyltransferase involved in cell wall biosynthesis
VPNVEVVIPTRNRPAKLANCLAALARARARWSFSILVCDSSDDPNHEHVRTLCEQYAFVSLQRHDGRNVAAARNACVRYSTCDTLINVDDDIQVEPDAIVELADHYFASSGLSVTAGSVAWDGKYSRPVVMRHIGYGRDARPGEPPSFLVGAFFAYSRALASALPWNENIRTSDDRFMGALWRSHGVTLDYAPDARATHDPEHVTYNVDEQSSHVYANLFDAVIANPDFTRAVSYELLGFLAGARGYCRSASQTRRYLAAWYRGHRQLVKDHRYLRGLVSRELPSRPGTAEHT